MESITEFEASHLVLEFKRLLAEIDLRNFLSFLLFYFVIFAKFRSTLTDVPWCNGNTYTKGISMEISVTRFSKFRSTI